MIPWRKSGLPECCHYVVVTDVRKGRGTASSSDWAVPTAFDGAAMLRARPQGFSGVAWAARKGYQLSLVAAGVLDSPLLVLLLRSSDAVLRENTSFLDSGRTPT